MEILRAEHLTKIYGKGNTSVTQPDPDIKCGGKHYTAV